MVYKRVIKKRVGDLLVERGVISKEQLEEALRIQQDEGGLLGQVLVENGMATEDQVVTCIANQYGLPFLPISNYNISPEVIEMVEKDVVYQYNIIPIDQIGDVMILVCVDVLNEDQMAELESLLNKKVQLFLTTPSGLQKAMSIYYPE